jgi:hypothetical protein
MGDFASLINRWWAKPFNPNGDVINWILFLGFVIVVTFAWTRVLRQITTE